MKELLQFQTQLNITFSPKQLEQFELYYKTLEEWTTHTNLTAIKEKDAVILKHFVDSLTCLAYIPEKTKTLIDVGSGAGFPGMIIAIMRPDISVSLLDSVGKKIDFLNDVAKRLDLKNVKALHGRAEDAVTKGGLREKFDVVTARAVAFLPTLLEYTLPLTKIDGVCLFQKLNSEEEINKGENALKILGGNMDSINPIEITGLENHSILLIKKFFSTPTEYPRETSLLLKKPL